MLCALGSRMRVTMLVCDWCPWPILSCRCGVLHTHVALVCVARNLQPFVAPPVTRVQEDVLPLSAIIKSIDCPHIRSPRPSSPPLRSDSHRPLFVFMVWVAIEQTMSDGWGSTVRSRHNDSEPRRIRIISSIYATTPRQRNSIQDATARTK